MRKRMLRVAVALFAAAVSASQAGALVGCPGNVVIGGTTACHLVSGSNCESCRYNCEGEYYTWNMCSPE